MNDEEILFNISVIVTSKNNLPAVELRSSTTNQELIKKIVSCAWNRRPIILRPVFYDELKSLRSLQDKGIIYKDENNQYRFTL